MSTKRRRSRISIVTTGLARGGAEAQVVLLATGLKRRGWEVKVASMLPPSEFLDELAQAGIEVVHFGMRRGVPDARALLRLGWHWRRYRPHVVHSHMIHANLLARVTRLICPVPVMISTAHSIDEGGGWRNYAYRWTDRLCDLTTNVSRQGTDRYLRLRLAAKSQMMFVPNGVEGGEVEHLHSCRFEIRRELGWKSEFVWLAVGNLREPKDYPTMLRAFAELPEDLSCRLVIVGEGPLRDSLEALAEELGVRAAVDFLGSRSDVLKLMAAADGFVMSSAWEGTPMALLEAGSMGLCPVATAVGGIPEVIEDARSGFLAPARNPDMLALRMRQLMTMKVGERNALGNACRVRVTSEYGMESVLDQWENIYSQLLLEKATPPHRNRFALTWSSLWGNK